MLIYLLLKQKLIRGYVCVFVCVCMCKREDEDVCQCKRNPLTIIATLLIFALMTDLSANNHRVNMIL